jgi:hypothetical protein
MRKCNMYLEKEDKRPDQREGPYHQQCAIVLTIEDVYENQYYAQERQ